VTTTIEQLSECVILLTIDTDLTEDQNMKEMIQSVSSDLNALLDRVDEPQTLIVQDAQKMRLNFSILVQALGMTTRGEHSFFAHPNIHQVIFVTLNNLVKVAATALSQSQYGGLKASVAPTLEEALKMLDA